MVVTKSSQTAVIIAAKPLPSSDTIEERTLGTEPPINPIRDYFTERLTHTSQSFVVPVMPHHVNLESHFEFMHAPTVEGYSLIAKEFLATYLTVNSDNFADIDEILLTPTHGVKVPWYTCPKNDLTTWLENEGHKFDKDFIAAKEKTWTRDATIESEGDGIGQTMTNINFGIKQTGRKIRDNMTIRGQVYRIADSIYGNSLNEMLPRYGVRKATILGLQAGKMTLNGLLTAAGFAFAVPTLGLSKVIVDHSKTGVSLGAESATGSLLGVKKDKIVGRAAMRAAQIETPKFIPVVGDAIEFAESSMNTVGTSIIVSSIFSDLIMNITSRRYVSKLGPLDLGDSRVLGEMTKRLKYLSQFLIPYGQKLLQSALSPAQKDELKTLLRDLMDAMRNMEIRRTRALNFYLVALAGGCIFDEHIVDIKADCLEALNEGSINCHQTAKECLATLLTSSAKAMPLMIKG